MVYQEYEPRPALKAAVVCLWTLEGHADRLGGAVQPVLPDGRPELVVHFGDAFERIEPGSGAAPQPSLLFAGQLTRQLVLRPTGRIQVLGVRFHPHGAAALLRPPQGDLAGVTIGVDDLSPPLARALARVRDDAAGPRAALGAVQSALTEAMDPSRIDPRVAWVVAAIDRRRGLVSVDRLAAGAGLTRRHLERRFQDCVGMTPKRLARVVRFQRALGCLEGPGGARGGAVTAGLCGYADQSHFIRDFRDLAGCPPGTHVLTRGILTGFFSPSGARVPVLTR